MTFDQVFRVDEASPLPPARLVTDLVSSAGAFERGLFSVLDERLSRSVLDSWRWLLGQDAIALVASAFGDLFFWSEKHGAVYFLEVQRGQSTFVDRNVSFLLHQFLTKEEILDRVLHRELFKALSSRLDKPKYRECYIAVPWPRLGGTGEVDTYTKGELVVYTNLVGQSVEQDMKLRRPRAH